MRYEKSERLLPLCLMMAGSHQGISLGRIMEEFEVSRKTAERMRDAAVRLLPNVTECTDEIRVAHNASFEQHFHAGDGRAWIDTRKCVLVIWPDAPAHSNQVLRYWLDLDRQAEFDRTTAMQPHRALPDAYITAHVLIRLLQECSIDAMVDISAKPALLRRIGFSKHRGLIFSEAPADYLKWIVDKAEFDADLTASARFWLDRGKV